MKCSARSRSAAYLRRSRPRSSTAATSRQQEKQIERLKDSERRPIPAEFEYQGIPGLSREVRDKLDRVRPVTLGQAARIPGVTPAAVAILDVYLSFDRVS